MDGLDNTLDGNLVMDAINLVASLESTFESLTFDRFEKLNKQTEGLLGEYLICGQPVNVSAESAAIIKSGIIATTIAAIVAAIVFVVRKFFNLPSIQNIKTRIRNLFENMFKTKKADEHIKKVVEPKAASNMEANKENKELVTKEFHNLINAFIKLNGDPSVANLSPPEFINLYASKTSVYQFISSEIFLRTIPRLFLTEASSAELANIEYLANGLMVSYTKKTAVLQTMVRDISKIMGDNEAILGFTVPQDDTSITVYKMYLHRNNDVVTDEIPLINAIIDKVNDGFSYENTASELDYATIFSNLGSSTNVTKLNTIVEKSKKIIESDKQYLNMYETELPRILSQLEEFSKASLRVSNNEASEKYKQIKDQLTMYIFTVNRTMVLLKNILNHVDGFIENNRKLDQDLFTYLKLYNEYTNKMVR